MLTQNRLKQLLKYSKSTGQFYWIERRAHMKAGSIAGSVKKSGYVEIRIDGKTYQAHRLAWLYVTGSMPESCIDHINMERADNRWRNLRAATHSENLRNKRVRRDSSSGAKCVHLRGSRFSARITVNGKRMRLGTFATREEAAAAYAAAAKKHHGEFARYS